MSGEESPAWCWTARDGDVRVVFVGRGRPALPEAALCEVAGNAGLAASWLEQVHSATVLAAAAGGCGQGDALWTGQRGLALVVKTADCVPVVLAGGGVVAAVHAGWRGLALEILAASLAVLPVATASLRAWIGPAIGPCCYEVGSEVASAVAAVAGPAVVQPGPRGRPHLDLVRAAATQLRRCGVERIDEVDGCTRCEGERLHSFRRDGAVAGRNFAFVWRAPEV